jgi:hypothetical protein
VIIGRIDLNHIAEVVVLITGRGINAAAIRPSARRDGFTGFVSPGDRPYAIRADVGFEKILAGWRKFY